MAKSMDDSVFGDVLRDDRARDEAAKRGGGAAGSGGRGRDPARSPVTHEPDPIDALVPSRPDPDAARRPGPSRVKLG